MPGRSCVALTLLISSLNDCKFRKFLQAARSAMRCTRNDSRHAGRNFASNANKQYKGPSLLRSIADPLLASEGSRIVSKRPLSFRALNIANGTEIRAIDLLGPGDDADELERILKLWRALSSFREEMNCSVLCSLSVFSSGGNFDHTGSRSAARLDDRAHTPQSLSFLGSLARWTAASAMIFSIS